MRGGGRRGEEGKEVMRGDEVGGWGEREEK